MRTQGNAFANSFDTPDDWALDSPLNAVPVAVNRRLNQYLAASQLEFLEINPLVTQAIETMGDFIVNGGKRVRPTFAWAGVRAGLDEAKATTAGGRQPLTTSGNDAQDPNTLANSFLSAISAFEFIQACALIHDDIVDQSDTRRGTPTVHRVFEGHHRQREWWGESAHYGTSQAILTGDLALAWADDLLWGSGLSPERLHQCRRAWRAMRTEVIGGQILDLAVEASGTENVDYAWAVIKYKTASYTVSRPLHVGAALAGASDQLVQALRTIGENIGIAFQLRDDQLGVFGDPAVTGKPSGDDLRTGKRTVLIDSALEMGSTAQAAALREGLGNVTAEDDVDALRAIIRDSGAAGHVESLITEKSEAAIQDIHKAGLSPNLTAELEGYARKLTARSF
ncbi:polyprenyl synthetase family protein [Corynebacterium sp. HMSC28B08]|uniref:polyprenyl synthetase family protein n=1 Tax=Corynebacterium sp. HMSC28B08 TaxID=1581066 RepID=UPI0008A3C6BB|nr:polyprenyl synthetase family protein [Corynebacterium sp. HMSC28B08]OFT88441.1 geranylgeranyl pyrophosphate synthase [Corynebacterium sp. HMSC28B08]